jgi:hypothetical protein
MYCLIVLPLFFQYLTNAKNRLLNINHEIRHGKDYNQNGHNKLYFAMKLKWHRIQFEYTERIKHYNSNKAKVSQGSEKLSVFTSRYFYQNPLFNKRIVVSPLLTFKIENHILSFT